MTPPPAPDPSEDAGERSNATKRSRWATQRMKSKSGNRKRKSIVGRLHRISQGSEKRSSAGGDTIKAEGNLPSEQEEAASEHGGSGQGPRTIYFNIPLPAEALDEQGHPLAKYRRNKIRTAKYTPLSFIPKDLWYQFHNIANIYFLFLIILAVSFAH